MTIYFLSLRTLSIYGKHPIRISRTGGSENNPPMCMKRNFPTALKERRQKFSKKKKNLSPRPRDISRFLQREVVSPTLTPTPRWTTTPCRLYVRSYPPDVVAVSALGPKTCLAVVMRGGGERRRKKFGLYSI